MIPLPVLLLAAVLGQTPTGRPGPSSDVSTSVVRATGSTKARSHANRWAEQVNVWDYADCDYNPTTATGHDDTANLQMALNAAAGKTLRVPASPTGLCCMASSALIVPSNTKIVGDGYGSCLTVKPGGWTTGIALPSTIDYGLLVLYGVHDVEIAGLRLRSAKDTSDAGWEYSPSVIQPTNVQDVHIHNNWIENAHYSCLWTGGTQSVNRRLKFQNNTVYDCGHIAQSDAMGHGGGGVIQWNGDDGVFTGNHLTKVGFGLSISGSNNVVSANRIDDFQGDAILCGDSQLERSCNVTSNILTAAPDLTPGGGIYQATGIYASNSIPGQPQQNAAHIAHNVISFTIANLNGRARCVDVSGVDAEVIGNQCLFDVQVDTSTQPSNVYAGFRWEATEWAPTIKVEQNTVWGFSSTGAPNYSSARGITGFSLVPNTQPISISSSRNEVKGLPETCAAWEEAYSGDGHYFKVQHHGDISWGGSIRVGQQFLAARNVPFHVAYDASADALNYQNMGVFYSGIYVTSITASAEIGASNLSGTNTGDVTLGASTNGLSISGQTLQLSAAGSGTPGGVTQYAQSFSGNKTFLNGLSTPGVYDTDTVNRVGTGASDFNRYSAPAGQLHEFKIGSSVVARIGNIAGTALVQLGEVGPFWTTGAGDPENVVTAPVGSLYSRSDGSTSTTLYVKTSGTGSTGWTAK